MSDDFFEDDEPIEDVLDAFNRGERGWTVGPRRLEIQVSGSLVATQEFDVRFP